MRAIAVLAVVFYHAGLGCPGGYVGVDVFFVISGYLITSLILRDLRAGEFSLVEFWERRARRIFPASIVCVMATLLVGCFLLLPADLELLGRSALAQSAFAANIYFWRTTNYFGGENLEKPLLHTWSLAVEEQFYLLFPLYLLLVFHFRGLRSVRRLISIVLLVFALSLILSIWGVIQQPFATFFLLPTRAWELLCGSLLAVVPAKRSCNRVAVEFFSWVGMTAILVPVVLYAEQTPFPGVAALPPCLGAMLLIWANALSDGRMPAVPRSSVAALLASSPFRFVGLISYSLYLWHWPVLVFADYWKTQEFTAPVMWFLVTLSFGLAVASWKWVENPFRERRLFATQTQIFAFASSSSLVTFGVGCLLVFGKGLPSRLPDRALTIANSIDRDIAELHRCKQVKNVSIAQIHSDELVKIGRGDIGSRPAFVLLGDSHAQVAVPFFDRLAKTWGVSGIVIAHQSTPPVAGWPHRFEFTVREPQEYFDASFEYIAENDIRCVFLMGFWYSYQMRADAELTEAIQRTIKRFESIGVEAHVLMDAPTYGYSVSKSLLRSYFFDFGAQHLPAQSRLEHERRNEAVYAAKRHARDGVFLDPAEKFWDSDRLAYRVEIEGLPLYRDGDHLSARGVETAWSDLLGVTFERSFGHPGMPVDKVTVSP